MFLMFGFVFLFFFFQFYICRFSFLADVDECASSTPVCGIILAVEIHWVPSDANTNLAEVVVRVRNQCLVCLYLLWLHLIQVRKQNETIYAQRTSSKIPSKK